ncbi:MAG: HD domain-containing protein [Deltaproteobacteria bacterium]|nr:HD domain-containing protein [Deltaproteobacteria bacterium]
MGKSNLIDFQELKRRLNDRESLFLVPGAAYSQDAIRRLSEEQVDGGHRQNYAVDSDRILHSLAYTRYIDKTQVFYLVDNDHITHRVLHVQLVSKISRTIGRFLGLNEDLIEAIALGHDIGHCPFGHDGETYLSEICQNHGIGAYQHNIQSVRFLERIERKGKGLNLTLQVLDGILCHDGELHTRALYPEPGKTFKLFDDQIRNKSADPKLSLLPMTLEGCVVRMADTISYVGRDIEDAIRLNLISRKQLPRQCVAELGDTNGTIVYNLVSNIISNSLERDAIAFSQPVSEALKELKEFNLKNIYLNSQIKPDPSGIKHLFQVLYDRYVSDLEKGDESSIIFSEYLNDMSSAYVAGLSPPKIARDFIAGMTDQFFLKQVPEDLRPKKISRRL